MNLDSLDLPIIVLIAEFSDECTLLRLTIISKSMRSRCAKSLQIQNIMLRRELQRVSRQLRQQLTVPAQVSFDLPSRRQLAAMRGIRPAIKLAQGRRASEPSAAVEEAPAPELHVPSLYDSFSHRLVTTPLVLAFQAFATAQDLITALKQPFFSRGQASRAT